MSETVLYVEKSTDLMRSVFVTFGLADLLYRTAGTGSGKDVIIVDAGGAYIIQAAATPDFFKGQVSHEGLPPLLPAILKPPSAKEKSALEGGAAQEDIERRYRPERFAGITINYGEEKRKAEARRSDKNKAREEGEADQRPPDFPLWAHLCSYFGKGSAMRIGYPLALHIWHAHQGQAAGDLFDLILSCYGDFPPDMERARARWLEAVRPQLNYPDFGLFGWEKPSAADVSALSIVSPTTAQGSYTDSAARLINTGTPEIFWLEMYLALAGYMQVGMPFRSGSDALLYYPLPREIHYSVARSIIHTYREAADVRVLYDQSGYLPRAKTDALAEINFYIAMVQHFQKNTPERRRIDALSGLVGYFYKDISAQIPFDETTFALPRWLAPDADRPQLEEAEYVLKQHATLISRIRGDYAEELTILNHYRSFATRGDPDEWVAFAITYSQHRFARLVDQPWLPFLTLSVLERTLMNTYQDQQLHKDYRPVLENQGFRNIAAAINACTTRLRYFKDVKKSQTAFKVRHGLGDDLRRRAHDADLFIEDLSEFIHSYMQESSNVQANTGETREFITDGDFYAVIDLMQQYGSRVVANLLVAAGYASHYDGNQS